MVGLTLQKIKKEGLSLDVNTNLRVPEFADGFPGHYDNFSKGNMAARKWKFAQIGYRTDVPSLLGGSPKGIPRTHSSVFVVRAFNPNPRLCANFFKPVPCEKLSKDQSLKLSVLHCKPCRGSGPVLTVMCNP